MTIVDSIQRTWSNSNKEHYVLDYAATKGRYDCEKEEWDKVKKFEKEGVIAEGLWLKGLCKTYKSGMFG